MKFLSIFKNKMSYEYMIIYSIPNGMGRICVTRDNPINSYDDLEELDRFIKEQNGLANLFVIDYKLLRKFRKRENNNA